VDKGPLSDDLFQSTAAVCYVRNTSTPAGRGAFRSLVQGRQEPQEPRRRPRSSVQPIRPRSYAKP
jgi:hypothetical protein